eukprot:401424_1
MGQNNCCQRRANIEEQTLEIANLAKQRNWQEVMLRIDKPPFKGNMENIMKINIYDHTLLHQAAEQGNLDIIKKLIAIGFDPNCLDKSKHSPIGFASTGGHMECVQYFVSIGANINIVDIHGHGALYAAATRDHLNIVKYLVSNGANINEKCKDKKWTPGQWARYYNKDNCAEYLENQLI